MSSNERLYCLDNLRTFLIFLVVLVHAGVVYESSGLIGPFWIVDDPSTSDLPGLLNLLMDIFVMPAIFFISGYLTPPSLARHGRWGFLKRRLRRLMVPWAAAVLTLMPLYKVIFLHSRNLPQESWLTYLHISNGGLGMSWLWFLPVLFLISVLYLLLRSLSIPTEGLTLGRAVPAVLLLCCGYSLACSLLGWIGWTKTPLMDFQNERLLPYLLLFLLGAHCYQNGALATGERRWRLLIAAGATAWIPTGIYVVVVLNLILRPGIYLVSKLADTLLLWLSFYTSMLMLLYCLVATFKRFLDRPGPIGRVLSPLSYNVYVVHMIVLGIIAQALLDSSMPALLKYPILALSTYVISNLLVYAYSRMTRRLQRFRTSASVSRSDRHGCDAAPSVVHSQS